MKISKTRLARSLALLILFAFHIPLLSAAELCVDSLKYSPDRPLVLVLSGGGARGIAHIGVLRELERNRIEPDLIVGSSIGGVVGALWSSGFSSDEIAEFFRNFDWSTMFSDKPRRTAMFLSKRDYDQQGLLTLRFGPGGRPIVPTAITNGQMLFNNLRHLFEKAPFQPNPSFNALRYPVRIVSCDLNTGERKIFDQGDLAIACRASLSYPLFLSPVPLDGHLFVDGGVAENIPSIVARELSPTGLILAIDCTAPVRQDTPPSTPWEVADRVTTILQIDRNIECQTKTDIIIKPLLDKISPTDFSTVDSVIALGEQAGIALIKDHPELLKRQREIPGADKVYVLGDDITGQTRRKLERPLSDRWEQYYRLANIYRTNNWINGYVKAVDHFGDRLYYTVQPPILRSLAVVGTSRNFSDLMKGETGLKIGEPLQIRDLDRTVEYLYGSGMFDMVYPVREAIPGGIKLTFIVQERTLPVLRLGAGYDNHRGGSGQVQLLYDNIFGITTHGAATFQFGEKDAIGSLRFHADRLIGRVGAIDFEVNATHTAWPRFEQSNLSAISYNRVGGSASLGQSVGRWSVVAAGLRVHNLRVTEADTSRKYQIAPFFIQYSIDTEDQSPFPTSGTRIMTAWETAQGKNITDYSYSRFYYYQSTSFKISKRLVLTPQTIGGFNSSSSPRSEWYRIGGPWDFWGLATGERESRNLGVAAITGRYDLISRLVADTYIEMRANIAVLSETHDLRWQQGQRVIGGGVAVAMSTWLGPVRLVWGWAGEEVAKSIPTVSVSLGSSIPNPLGPRTIFK